MNILKSAGAQVLEQSGETASPESRSERPEAAIRPLQDWELLLAGGGDGNPGWPT
jgi:hypothetical protein